MSKFIAVVIVGLFVVINVIGVAQYQSSMGLTFGPGEDGGATGPMVGAATLFGIVVSALVAALKQLPQDRRVRISELKTVLLRPNTFIALLVTPVVFYPVLVGLGGHGAIGPLTYLAAFQNGFFWQTALGAMSQLRSTQLS